MPNRKNNNQAGRGANRRRGQQSGAITGMLQALSQNKMSATSARSQGAAPLRVRSSSAQSTVRAATGPIPDYARLMADPLRGPLVGRPDDNSVGSIMRRDVTVYTASSDAAGSLAISVGGGLYQANAYSSYTITAGSTGSAVSTSTASYASLNTDFPNARSLAYVVQVRYIGAEQTAAGRIAGMVSMDQTIPSTVITDLMDNIEGTVQKATDGLSVIVRPVRVPIFASHATSLASFMPFLHVVLVGAPVSTSNVVEITMTRIIELLPTQGSTRSSDVVACPCDMVACCVAANISGTKTTLGKNGDYAKLVAAGLNIAKLGIKAFAPPGYAAAIAALAAAVGV